MSKVVDFITMKNIIIGCHQSDDVELLGTFLLALSRADFNKLGVRGNCEIIFKSGDYIAIFNGGNIVRRPTISSALVFRQFSCAAGCGKPTLSTTSKAEFCQEHRVEFLELDEAKAV